MLNLICINENNVAYVETECKKVFGIVNSFKVIDEDGYTFEGSASDILESYADVEQDFDSEANVISFIESNGESSKLYITVDGIKLVDDNDK